MNPITDYLVQNWALILILIAFIVVLTITVFLDKKTVIRMYILIVSIFIFSITVFTEFYLADLGEYKDIRIVLMAIRYSATPIIVALILYTLVKRARWYVLIPAFVFTVINFISIFTGIVFSIDSGGELKRGALGYLPFISVGLYSVALIFVLIRQSNKQITEIIPISFLALAFASGLIFPFVIGKDYSKIFCTTIGVALFVYYVFLILQLTKKDALTGLFNRQAYYSSIKMATKGITAIVSIDMNGLKETNDKYGHLAGDEALITLARCFMRATKIKQAVYRIGGDEFIIICRKTSEEELNQLVNDITQYVSETPYSCAIGYCFIKDGAKDIDEMVSASDEMMYANKAAYYSQENNDRRAL